MLKRDPTIIEDNPGTLLKRTHRESKLMEDDPVIKKDDAEIILKRVQENSRLFTLLAKEMLTDLPELCPGDVLSTTYLHKDSQAFSARPVTYLTGLSSIISSEVTRINCKGHNDQKYVDKVMQLDHMLNQR